MVTWSATHGSDLWRRTSSIVGADVVRLEFCDGHLSFDKQAPNKSPSLLSLSLSILPSLTFTSSVQFQITQFISCILPVLRSTSSFALSASLSLILWLLRLRCLFRHHQSSIISCMSFSWSVGHAVCHMAFLFPRLSRYLPVGFYPHEKASLSAAVQPHRGGPSLETAVPRARACLCLFFLSCCRAKNFSSIHSSIQ